MCTKRVNIKQRIIAIVAGISILVSQQGLVYAQGSEDLVFTVGVCPIPPTNLVVTVGAPNSGEATLDWDISITPNVNNQRIEVVYPDATEVHTDKTPGGLPGTPDTYLLSGLQVGGVHNVRIVSIAGSYECSSSGTVYVPFIPEAAGVDPVTVFPEPAENYDPSENTNTIYWSDAVFDNAPVNDPVINPEYYLEASRDVGFTDLLPSPGWISMTQYTVPGLTVNQTYYYRVMARNGDDIAMESIWSNIVSSKQIAEPAPPPGGGGGTGGGGGGGGGGTGGGSPGPGYWDPGDDDPGDDDQGDDDPVDDDQGDDDPVDDDPVDDDQGDDDPGDDDQGDDDQGDDDQGDDDQGDDDQGDDDQGDDDQGDDDQGDDDQGTEEELHEAAEEDREGAPEEGPPADYVAGVSRAEFIYNVYDKLDLETLYADQDKRCQANLNYCMYPFLVNSYWEGADPNSGFYYIDVFTEDQLKAIETRVVEKVTNKITVAQSDDKPLVNLNDMKVSVFGTSDIQNINDYTQNHPLVAANDTDRSNYVAQQLLLDGEQVVTEEQMEAIHFMTRQALIQGFYTDFENKSPFGPWQTVTRIESMKILAGSIKLVSKWIYFEEYTALLGGAENIDKQSAPFADIKPSAEPPYYMWWYPRYLNAICGQTDILTCDENIKFNPDTPSTEAWADSMLSQYILYTEEDDHKDIFADSDGDGIINQDEIDFILTNPNDEDSDNDGLDDGLELHELLTNPLKVDSDSDGLSDGEEVNTYNTNPLIEDTDMDRFSDYIEIQMGTDPLDIKDFPLDLNGNGVDDAWEELNGLIIVDGLQDTDRDGLSDVMEFQYGTDPRNPDTDGDGILDGDEILLYQTDPLTKTDLTDLGVAITNLKDGMVIATSRPFIQGVGPVGSDVELLLRNEFGHEILLGNTEVSENGIFQFKTSRDLADGEFFFLAKSLDEENRAILQSSLIKVKIDTTLNVLPPEPKRLDDVTLSEEVLLKDLKVVVRNGRPALIGTTDVLNTVNASWASIIGASAVIVDTADGWFEIQAPKELAVGDHEVIVSAFRPADNAVSDIIRIKFEVKKPVIELLKGVALGEEQLMPWYGWLIMFLIGSSLAFVAWRRRKKKIEISG